MTKERALELLEDLKKLSHDPDTQTACVVESEVGVYLGAANRFPRNVQVTPERLKRPAKYAWMLHAERNAIAQAAEIGFKLTGCSLYLNWFPCSDCAASMVQAGIVRLVADRDLYEARKDDPRYGFDIAMTMLVEGGVQVEWFQEAA